MKKQIKKMTMAGLLAMVLVVPAIHASVLTDCLAACGTAFTSCKAGCGGVWYLPCVAECAFEEAACEAGCYSV